MTRDIRFLGHGLVVDASRAGGGEVVGTFDYQKTPTPAEVMQSDLQAIATRTHGQLMDLAREPSRDRCDWMIRALAEVSTLIHRLRTELERQPK